MSDSYTKILNQDPRADSSRDCDAEANSLSRLYDELKQMARHKVLREQGDISATVLVHEVYLRLFDGKHTQWDNRGHFFAAAAESMRRVLVDMARQRNSLKRGGDLLRVTLSETAFRGGQACSPADFLDLNQAIESLQSEDANLAEIVKLRFFAGQTMDAIAKLQGVSLSSVERKWRFARAYLIDQLSS